MKQTMFPGPSKIAFFKDDGRRGLGQPKGEGVQHVESMRRERNIKRYLF
jgi:hypothetical protein